MAHSPDMMTRLPMVRLPFDALDRLLAYRYEWLLRGRRVVASRDLEPILGVSYRTIERWRSQGFITMDAADGVAVAIGLHPGSIWPEWFKLNIEAA